MKNQIGDALQKFNAAEMTELLANLDKQAKEKKLRAVMHECLRNAEIDQAPQDLRTAWAHFLARNPLHVAAQAVQTMEELWGENLHWKMIAQFLQRPGQGLYLGTHFSFKAPAKPKGTCDKDITN